jgi:general secretion pathway protein J
VTSGRRATKLRRRGQAGFTLLEALVAVTLLSLLSLALTRSLRFGVDAWARGSSHSDQLSRTTVVQGLLRRVVGETYPYFVSNGPTRMYVDFEGTSESLALLASAPVVLGGAGRSRFRLSLAKHDGLSDLVMTSQAELAPPDAPSAIEKKTLLAGTTFVEFAYFGRWRSEANAQWHDRWTGQSALPQLVRIQVGFPEGDTPLWPDLVIAPRIAVDIGCVYDLLTKQCRGR